MLDAFIIEEIKRRDEERRRRESERPRVDPADAPSRRPSQQSDEETPQRGVIIIEQPP